MSLYLLICVKYYKHFYKNKILSTNQKQELPVVAMFVNGSGRNEHSIDASYHISVHLAVRFQRRFLEIDQSETKIDCGGHIC